MAWAMDRQDEGSRTKIGVSLGMRLGIGVALYLFAFMYIFKRASEG